MTVQPGIFFSMRSVLMPLQTTAPPELPTMRQVQQVQESKTGCLAGERDPPGAGPAIEQFILLGPLQRKDHAPERVVVFDYSETTNSIDLRWLNPQPCPWMRLVVPSGTGLRPLTSTGSLQNNWGQRSRRSCQPQDRLRRRRPCRRLGTIEPIAAPAAALAAFATARSVDEGLPVETARFKKFTVL